VKINGEMHRVHRLVLCAFAASLPSYSWVANHLDGNKQNNVLENLEFATPAQNVKHAYRSNLYKQTRAGKPVLGRSLSESQHQTWMHFESAAAAAAHVGCTKGSVFRVCRGECTSVKGWKFKNYVSDDPSLPDEQWAPVVLEFPAEV